MLISQLRGRRDLKASLSLICTHLYCYGSGLVVSSESKFSKICQIHFLSNCDEVRSTLITEKKMEKMGHPQT